MIKELLFGTFVLILVFLLLSQYQGADKLFGTLIDGYNKSVKTLQGR